MENHEQDQSFPVLSSFISCGWMAPISSGPTDAEQLYPPPNSFSPLVQAPSTPASYSQLYPSATSTSSSAPESAFRSAPKVAIPRLSGAETSLGGRRRCARACERCRHRKIKCDGLRPSCGQCIYQNHPCSYEDVKRVRDRKRLETLAKRVGAYEALLRELAGEVNLPTARQIRKVLQAKNVKSSEQNDLASDDSSTSLGSLEAIDQVDEDLDPNESSCASGYFGKSSEVDWIRKLDSGVRTASPLDTSESSNPFNPDSQNASQRESLEKFLPISMMGYHLGNMEIPFIESCDLMPCHREN
ncbi:hypothetical protein N7499_003168 [Penicillium canescens]|uniref:Zn(2)-C6 fungal-type domain-containing protein n=1 Tax=Penicillium canescens TaxID=5083 RepID=A0AAD6IB45_PENCN|nr:uncharacterized protein N7446_012026 [Penicillium canescens]KAJ6019748.1 hypothetical protein N7522_000456 [Penicillium canescens]KAJ6039033.1 hypothetical protein N7460_007065 [Penicillium canescens]KAJ6047192.1 hypothetical protein N7446_012026 [Penicillium canescens]KAJ6060077.1 hypothetical protein N7444_002823 [Penicillium canescens]KAJ6093837.1 hypothetical protein N7499_003168 [Penicillium canescens]